MARALTLMLLLFSLSQGFLQAQYNLAVAAIFRNEAPYFREWIEYHRMMGVEHFYLYNNESTDDFHSVLDPYIQEGIVTLIEWPNRPVVKKSENYEWVVNTQLPCYEHACRIDAVGRTKWLAMIDIDEFLLPMKDKNMTELLKRYEEYPAVSINWQVYGTSEQKTWPKNKLLIELFHRVAEPNHSLHDCVKTILKPELYAHFEWMPHTCAYLNGKAAAFPTKDEVRLNHYINRTEDYFLNTKVVNKERAVGYKMGEEEIQNWLKVGNALEDDQHAIFRFVPELRQRLGYSVKGYSKEAVCLTDNGVYPVFCKLAATDKSFFKNFKRSSVHAPCVEHVTQSQGLLYLQNALTLRPEYLQKLKNFQQNDRFGGPVTYSYGLMGDFSPTTLRYVHAAANVEKLFGSLDGKNIVEIGGGYGGQCLTLSKVCRWKNYTIVDSAGPLQLAKTYLTLHGVKNVIYKTKEELTGQEQYDLVISNFGFSECTRAVQQEYVEKLLLRAESGYLTCNDFSDHPQVLSLKKDELKGALQQKAYQLLPEYPETGSRNYRVVWPAKPQAADLVVFSYDRPLQLYAFLESAEKYLTGVNAMHVIYRVNDETYEAGYQAVKERFPTVLFQRQSEKPREDFKPLVLEAVYGQSPSPYVLFAVDDIIIKDAVDLQECAVALERQKAWGFFLRLGKNISYSYMMNQPSPPPSFSEKGELLTWKFGEGVVEWAYPNNVDMTLYRKDDIRQFLTAEAYANPNELEFIWTRYADSTKCGLAFQQSKIVNVPLNLAAPSHNRSLLSHTTSDLLTKFQEGLKMDIEPLHEFKHDSPHAAYEPVFVMR